MVEENKKAVCIYCGLIIKDYTLLEIIERKCYKCGKGKEITKYYICSRCGNNIKKYN